MEPATADASGRRGVPEVHEGAAANVLFEVFGEAGIINLPTEDELDGLGVLRQGVRHELNPPMHGNEPRPSVGKLPPQVVGNVGLYYVCFRLSERGWNVLPTSRNTRGIDIICFSPDAARMTSIQVKSLSRQPAVPLGNDLSKIMGDWWVIVTSLSKGTPRTYILHPDEVQALAQRNEKRGVISYWLPPDKYAVAEFEEKWQRIGSA